MLFGLTYVRNPYLGEKIYFLDMTPALVYLSGPWENALILWQDLIFYCFKLQISLT